MLITFLPYILFCIFLAIPQAIFYRFLINYLKNKKIESYKIKIFASLLAILTLAFPLFLLYNFRLMATTLPEAQSMTEMNIVLGFGLFMVFFLIYSISVLIWWLIFYVWQERKGQKVNLF